MLSSAASKVMWEGRTKALILGLVIAETALATSLLVLAVTRPAEAAFPGANGRIVFSSLRDGDREIFTMKPDGTGITQLTNDPAIDDDPAWSPNGRKIAFNSHRNSDWQLFVMNKDGTRQRSRTEVGEGSENPDWQPIPWRDAGVAINEGSGRSTSGPSRARPRSFEKRSRQRRTPRRLALTSL